MQIQRKYLIYSNKANFVLEDLEIRVCWAALKKSHHIIFLNFGISKPIPITKLVVGSCVDKVITSISKFATFNIN